MKSWCISVPQAFRYLFLRRWVVLTFAAIVFPLIDLVAVYLTAIPGAAALLLA